MSGQIVATEEIRDVLTYVDRAPADRIATHLGVSTKTVRRHLARCIERGWITSTDGRRDGHKITLYSLTASGRDASEHNEGF